MDKTNFKNQLHERQKGSTPPESVGFLALLFL